MNRLHWKKGLILLTAICCVLVLTGAAALAEGETKDALARIREKGTLVIATEGTWSPWNYHDENGVLTGLDVEIGRLIAEGLGVEPEFKEAPWGELLMGVDSGRFDIVCNGVGYTEERARSFAFTEPYVYSNKVLVVGADNEDIHTVEDLKGKTTANSPSSTYADLAASYGANVVFVETLGETMAMLEQGRVDATINAQESVGDYLREHPDAKIKTVQVLSGDPVAFPLKKGEDTDTLVAAINEILEAARADGRLAQISMTFFNVDATVPE